MLNVYSQSVLLRFTGASANPLRGPPSASPGAPKTAPLYRGGEVGIRRAHIAPIYRLVIPPPKTTTRDPALRAEPRGK